MEKESKEQKIWVSSSETINTGEYENVKIEAGYSQMYEDEDPVKLIKNGIKSVRKQLKKEAHKVRLRKRRDY